MVDRALDKPSPQPTNKHRVQAIASSINTTGRTIVYWGPEGSGKTHCACTAPNPVVITFEENLDTMLKLGVPYLRPGGPGASYAEMARDWRTNYHPLLRNRELTDVVRELPGYEDYTVETVVFDGYTGLGLAYLAELSGDGASKLGFDGWGVYKNYMSRDTRLLTRLSESRDGQPGMNVIATVHETHEYDEDGRIQSITPSIDGKFKFSLLSRWNTVIVCQVDRKPRTEGTGSKAKTVYERQFLHWTVPPNKHQRAKDGFGDPSRGMLPACIEGGATWPVLAKHWGLNDGA